jgi:hypothetical protein
MSFEVWIVGIVSRALTCGHHLAEILQPASITVVQTSQNIMNAYKQISYQIHHASLAIYALANSDSFCGQEPCQALFTARYE